MEVELLHWGPMLLGVLAYAIYQGDNEWTL